MKNDELIEKEYNKIIKKFISYNPNYVFEDSFVITKEALNLLLHNLAELKVAKRCLTKINKILKGIEK